MTPFSSLPFQAYAPSWRRRRNRGQWLLVIGVLAACVVVGVVLGVIGGG